jgi:uncharacterized RDD family membrane protein YckC
VFAGFGQRLLAQLIDGLLLSVTLSPLVLLGMQFGEDGELSRGAAIMLDVIVMLLVLLFWVQQQATPGKRMLGLLIVDAGTGGAPSFGQYVARYIGYVVASIPLGLGLAWMLWDPKRQGWQDKMGRTLVIRVPR